MSRPLIDTDELIFAMEHSDPEIEYFLDRETGEILMLSSPMYSGTDEGLEEKLENDPGRYIHIDPIPSSVSWEVMADFNESLPESGAKAELAGAIQRNHSFRRFKDTLLAYPKIRQEWFRFHGSALTKLAEEWLEEAGIEAELKPLPGP